MSKYGTFACPDCGTTVDKTSPNMKRCKPCALKAHGQTGDGFSERACVVCGVLYKPTGSHQKACSGCAKTFKSVNNTARLKKLRDEAGATPIGSIKQCSSCGDDFVYSSGPQHRCTSCQGEFEIQQTRDWLAANPDKFAAYTATAKDNYSFGGNRRLALERDGHTCQHCGATSDLHVHHIDGNGVTSPRETRNNALDNLVTLCRGCHTKVHRAHSS